MPLNHYGVWKGKIKSTSVNTAEYLTDHFFLHFDFDFDNTSQPGEYRACMNYRSSYLEYPSSNLVFWLVQDLLLPTCRHIETFPHGWNEIIQLARRNHRQVSLDYLRGTIYFVPSGEMSLIPDDITDILEHFFKNAIEMNATASIYGQLERGRRELVNVHMNQGSVGRFEGENAIRQDGGVLLEFSDGH
ncbi:O-methyltransferase [Fusarium beomiforme]|uniref:O-methyltransferase n=1 Tax=Fusarium beomiforme TaxID=44412 RepID=A0A9P5AFC8_9HYPO|nr:O-methyltransferase [Fusarium beomiforme]